MSGLRLAFAEAAEGLVGTPFRFRGRDPRTGLDCVGVVVAALEKLGRRPPPLAAYALRQSDFAAQLSGAADAGFGEITGPAEAGDLFLLKPGPAQLHLAIIGRGGSLIHAHAGLGRVAITPPPCPWPIERRWRLHQD